MVKNLAQLKRTLVKGVMFEIVTHARQGCVGQRRRVNVADSTGFLQHHSGPVGKSGNADKQWQGFISALE